MNPTQTETPNGAGSLPSSASAEGMRYETCESCGAPLDHRQRYCVNCAARRPDPENPANRYFASAGRRTRAGAPAPAPAPEQAAPLRGAAVLLLVVLPIAVAIGVLVGKDQGDNADLLAALEKSGGAGPAAESTATTVSDTGGAIPSSFPLEKGYTVSLEVLPEDKTDAAAVAAAEDDAESKGADAVGVINQKDFSISPDVGSGYIIYSGEFKSKGDADKALDKLKGDFSDAKVVKVTASGGGSSSPAGEVVDHTDYGDVHDVTKLQPSDEAGALGMDIAEDQANQTGQDYIDGQKDLPDVIQVGPG